MKNKKLITLLMAISISMITVGCGKTESKKEEPVTITAQQEVKSTEKKDSISTNKSEIEDEMENIKEHFENTFKEDYDIDLNNENNKSVCQIYWSLFDSYKRIYDKTINNNDFSKESFEKIKVAYDFATDTHYEFIKDKISKEKPLIIDNIENEKVQNDYKEQNEEYSLFKLERNVMFNMSMALGSIYDKEYTNEDKYKADIKTFTPAIENAIKSVSTIVHLENK